MEAKLNGDVTPADLPSPWAECWTGSSCCPRLREEVDETLGSAHFRPDHAGWSVGEGAIAGLRCDYGWPSRQRPSRRAWEFARSLDELPSLC